VTKHRTEFERLARMQGRVRLLSDAELEAIRNDTEAGIARELADDEIGRRARLTAHERIREAGARMTMAGRVAERVRLQEC
jgi:hypothetical protein